MQRCRMLNKRIPISLSLYIKRAPGASTAGGSFYFADLWHTLLPQIFMYGIIILLQWYKYFAQAHNGGYHEKNKNCMYTRSVNGR